MAGSDLYARIYEVVRQVPIGRVSTYGRIAARVERCGARQVGYALAALKDDAVPWQRIINAKGEISHRDAEYQRDLLTAEGIEFDARGRVNLARFGWR
ncbi:MAG: MGMT family protein [Sandaracinaceae bacterium]